MPSKQIPNTYAEHSLAEKFGASMQQVVNSLQQTRQYTDKLGICFHVGSQYRYPDAYRIAIRLAAKIIHEANASVQFFDVGGGFPSIYPGMISPSLSEYFNAIHEELFIINKNKNRHLMCEPGRSLVAESTSVIVRVDMRKEDKLYINDGTYASLFDAGMPHLIFPVRVVRPKLQEPSHLLPYSFYGPTCDTLDFMKGPFYLPEDVSEGEYIEVWQVGAYARALATRFIGFGHQEDYVIVGDKPLMTMYNESQILEEPLEVIAG